MNGFEKLLLAFHYVWYGSPWGPAGAWRHWTGGHEPRYNPDLVFGGRRMLDAPHYPLDGAYDSLDPVVIRRQLHELRLAGVNGSIVSWWGVGDYSDRVLDALVEPAADANYRVTVYYETPMVERGKGEQSEAALIADDMRSILDRHAAAPAWLTTGSRPVIVIYRVDLYPLTVWREARERLRAAGFDPYWLGDAFDLAALEVMDGLHTYNPLRRLVTGEDLAGLYRQTTEAARAAGKNFAPTVIPGFDDRKIRTPGTLLSREDGGCYNRTWRAALACRPDWVLLTSWNEWHEGSEIEPSLEYGSEYLWLTAQWVKGFKQ
jgi:hypothetical protein